MQVKNNPKYIEDIKKFSKKYNHKIILCHGVFDVFHIGHLNYLKDSKKLKGKLLVSITSDEYVNKGPNRPLFNHYQRAEIISNLDFVDYVYINFESDAINLIKTLKPSYYCKGKDYEDFSLDISNKIKLEKKIVEKNKGKFVIIETRQFSSSNIINKKFTEFNQSQINILKKSKKIFSKINFEESFESLKKIKVCLIGEIIFDNYVFCETENLSTKSPTVSSKFLYEESYLGGVLAVYRNLIELGISVDLYTHASSNEISKIKRKIKSKKSDKIFNFNFNSNIPKKTRFINKSLNQKMFEVYDINTLKLLNKSKKNIINKIKDNKNKYDLILINDFGHGLMSNDLINYIQSLKISKSVNVQTNSDNYGYNLISKYSKINYFCIDQREAKLAINNRNSETKILYNGLTKKFKNINFTITIGKNGSISNINNKKTICPAFFDLGIDATGAGDMYFLISSILNYKNFNPILISFISNIYAGLQTRIIGNSKVINRLDFLKTLKSILK